jgi:hypothetical protein
MNEHTLSEKELKLTAAVYATRAEVVETIHKMGKLPETIALGGFPIAANVIIRQRGTDITLTENEQLVYDAILREHRLPGGSVRLVEDYLSRVNSTETP